MAGESSWDWTNLHTSKATDQEKILKAAAAAQTSGANAESKQISDRMHAVQIISKIAELKRAQEESAIKAREHAEKMQYERAKLWTKNSEDFIKNIYEPDRKTKIDQLNKELAARLKIPPENRQKIKDEVEISRTFIQAAQLIADGVLTKEQAERMFEPGMPFANVRNLIRMPIQKLVFEFLSGNAEKRKKLFDDNMRIQATAGQAIKDDEAIIEAHEKRIAEIERLDMNKAARYADWMVARSGFPGSSAEEAPRGGPSNSPQSASRQFGVRDIAKYPVTSMGGYVQNVKTGDISFAPTYDATGAQASVYDEFNSSNKGKKAPIVPDRLGALKYLTNKLSPEDNITIRGKTNTTTTGTKTSGVSADLTKEIDEYLRSAL